MDRPIVIDANVCVLLVFGLTNPSYIARNKRLAAFDEIDFDIVNRIVSSHSGVIFTPNVVTETSNLVRYAAEPYRTEASKTLAVIVQASKESYIRSHIAVEVPEYHRLGVTDCVLLLLTRSNGTLLTTDLDLYLAAARAELPVINYNHIREARSDYR